MDLLKSISPLAWLNYALLLFTTILVIAILRSVVGYQLELPDSGFITGAVTIALKIFAYTMQWILVILITVLTLKDPVSAKTNTVWITTFLIFATITWISIDFTRWKQVRIHCKTGDQHAATAWRLLNRGDFKGAQKSLAYAEQLSCDYNYDEKNSVRTLLHIWDLMEKGEVDSASRNLQSGRDMKGDYYLRLIPSSTAVKKFPPLDAAAKQSIEHFLNDSIHLLVPYNSYIWLQQVYLSPQEPQDNEPNSKAREYTMLAMKLYEQHQYAKAGDELDKAIAADSNYAFARFNKVFVDVMMDSTNNDTIPDQEKVEEAMQGYASWAENKAQTANDYILLGLAELSSYSGSKSIDRAIELKPKMLDAHLLKAYYLTGRGRLSLEDLPYFERVLQLDPDNFMATKSIGDMWYFENDYPKALEWYNKALKLRPDNVRALYNKAVLLLKCKQWEQANLVLTQALQAVVNPGGQISFNYACSLFFIGRYEDAIEAFKLAKEREANEGDCELMIGLAYLKQGNRTQALQHLNTALDEGTLSALMLIPLTEE